MTHEEFCKVPKKFDKILDEAASAELDKQDVAELMCGSYEGWQMIEMFKAGAKWMSEQGVIEEKTVDRTPLNGPNGVTVFLYDFDGFQPGDKVIVQIRKKEK